MPSVYDIFEALMHAGYQPWEPSPDVMDMEVWHQYDAPLVGTFKFQDSHVMFAALNPADPQLTFWCYIVLIDDDMPLVTETWDSLDKLYGVLSHLYKNRTICFAVVEGDNLLIQRWDVMEVGDLDMFLGKGIRTISS